MLTGLRVARATVVDAERILALRKLAFQSQAELYEDFNLPPLLQTLEEMQAEFETHIVLKATREDVIIGSVHGIMADGVCQVGRLVIEPDLQGQGIGRLLLQEIERAFPAARAFQLFTGHRSEPGLHLYRRLGYEEYRSEIVSDLLTLVFLEKRV
jgi:ribosomal protein S18 acetylase RimI-like enzyme